MTSTSGAKISMFGAKSGFVIPKNKLSGSLVPIFQRGSKTLGGTDSDPLKLGKRKTNWGPDLTKDLGVKKSRFLAYQKRLDQITQQLETENLEVETNKEPALVSQNNRDTNIAEQLELEKREAIGEMLGLNPRYKAPPDYKPLLKEAILPIDVKEYSNFNFLSLIFGSQGDTQKRLEKETGAKVQIFGTKTGGEKVELSSSDENQIQTPWEELYFQISSDTYEKVDGAIAVIELLLSSLSDNTGVGVAPPSSKSEDISTISSNSNKTDIALISKQPTDSSVQPPQSQLQQHGSEFPVASDQAPFQPPLKASASGVGMQVQELPTNSINLGPLSAQLPFPVPRDTSLPASSHVPLPPDLFSFNLSNTPRAYSVTAPTYSGSQIQSVGPRSTTRPSTLFTFQPVHRPTPLPDIISSNMGQSVRPLAPNFSQHPVAHHLGTEIPSNSFPSSNLKHLAEYGSGPFGGSLRPISTSAHVASRPTGLVPTYPPINPPTNTPPRPFRGDFSFLSQQANVVSTPQMPPPRPNYQSAHLPHLAFQAPSMTPASQHFGQSFTRSQQLGRQMDQPVSHLSEPFHSTARSSNLQNFGPPLSRMMPRNFPGAQFPQHSAHLPQRPAFHHDNLISRGQPQIRHRFNVHQVYDPFSPSDA